MGKRNKNKKNINNNINKNTVPKIATNEQMETIHEFLGKYSVDLKKDLDKLDLLTKISSSNGQYNPILSEQYLNDMLFNPKSASSEQITNWLMNPQANNKNIRALSQYLESAVGQYGRAIWEYNVEKSWKYMLVPSDVSNSEYVNSFDYKHSYELAANVCRKLNIKSQFPKIDLTVMEKGVAFYLIEEKSDSISLLELPTEYCYITAPWTYGWMFAVDLTFFDRMITMPNILPELTEAYQVLVNKRLEGFNSEQLAPWQYFNLPVEKSFCFTFNPNRPDKLPPLTGSMTAALDVISYRELLRKKSLLDLWKIIALKIPVDKDTKRPILTYTEAAEYIAMIQDQTPENIVSFVSPFDATEISSNQVSTLDSLVGLGNNNIYSSIGLSPNAFGLDNKNAGAIRLSLEIAFFYASTHMYAQFANLVNWLIYLKTRKYKWQVSFFGMKLNHDKEIDKAVSLTAQTNFPIEYLMANVGLEPFQVESFVNWSNQMDLKSKMKPLQSMNTQSGKPGESGRPEGSESNLSDAGEKSREYKE
jgi:hypothetical protein